MYQICLEALILTSVISLVPMIAVSIASGCVALLQAVTQLQEQSVVHLVRCITVAGVVVVFGMHGAVEVERFFIKVVEIVGAVGAR